MNEHTTPSPVVHILIITASFIVIVAGMKASEEIIVPFLLSAFIAVICTSPLLWLKKRGVPPGFGLLIILVGITIIIILVAVLVGTSLQDFSHNVPSYQAHLGEEVAGLLEWLQKRGITLSQQEILKYINPGAAMQLFASTLTNLGSVLTNAFLIVLTVVFILLEVTGFPLKLNAALSDAEASRESLNKIAGSIKHYMAIKTLTSFATGISIAVWLAIIGVDYPLLWGLVAFLLNYVPNIGSIIAAVPAVLLAFIQFGIIKTLLAVLGYVVVNLVIGNVIEPRVMGRSMGLSTLVVFLSLVFWGWVLGPVGMLLSVPLTMIVKISLEYDEGTKSIAILLGSNPSAEAALPVSLKKSSAQ